MKFTFVENKVGQVFDKIWMVDDHERFNTGDGDV